MTNRFALLSLPKFFPGYFVKILQNDFLKFGTQLNKKQKLNIRLKKRYYLSIIALISCSIFYLIIVYPSSNLNKFEAIENINTYNFQVASAHKYFLKFQLLNNWDEYDLMKKSFYGGSITFGKLKAIISKFDYLKCDYTLQFSIDSTEAFIENLQKSINELPLNKSKENKIELLARWESAFSQLTGNISKVTWRIEELNRAEESSIMFYEITASTLIIFFFLLLVFYLHRLEEKRTSAHIALEESVRKFKYLFDKSPISLWEEDFTYLMNYIQEKKDSGIIDFRKYLDDNPSEIEICINKIKILDVNEASLFLFKAENKEQLLSNLAQTFTDSSRSLFKEEVITLAEGKDEFYFESDAKTLDGEIMQIALKGYINKDLYEGKITVILATYNLTDRRRFELLSEEKQTHEIVISLLQFANKTKSEDEIRNKFFEVVHKVINYSIGIICDFSSGTKDSYVKSYDDNYQNFSKKLYWDSNEINNLINKVIETKASQIENNIILKINPIGKENEDPFGINFLGIPLKLDGEIFGVAALINKEKKITELDKEKIKIVSTVFSEIIEKKRLDSRITEYQDELEELVNKRTVELKNANLKLHEAKDKAENYLNVANVMMVAIDKDGIIVLLNKEGHNILECPNEGVIGKNWFSTFIGEKNRGNEKERINNIFKSKNKKLGENESEIITCLGKRRTIYWHYSIVKNEIGETQSLLCSGADITELKVKNKELRKLNHDLRRADGIAKLGNWQFNVSSNRITWTSQVYEIFGIYKKTSISKEKFISLLHKNDRWILEKILNSHDIPVDVKETNFRIEFDDNTHKHIKSIVEKVWDEKGKTKNIFGIIQDITDEKHIERELRESEERYKTVSDTAIYGTLIHKEGRIVFANPKANEIYGAPNNESIVGKNVIDQVHDDDKKYAENRIKRIYSGEENDDVVIIKLLNFNKEKIIAEVSSTKIKFENEVAIHVTLNDISREIEREAEKKLLMAAMHKSGPGIVVTTTDGEITYVNSKYENLTKFTSDELIGTQLPLLSNTGQNSGYYNSIINEINSGNTWQEELKDLTKDKNIYWASVSISPMHRNGEIVSYLSISEDITEKKRMLRELKIQKLEIEKQNEELEEKINERTAQLTKENSRRKDAEVKLKDSLKKATELNVLKSQFISTATHDFKTPLTAIKSSNGLLRKHCEEFSVEKHINHFNRIEKNVESLLSSINEVIKIGKSEMAIVKFNPVVTPIEPLARSIEEGIDITLNDKQDLECEWDFIQEEIIIDKKLMKTILSNLLSNAIKYSQDGGLIKWSMSTGDNLLLIEIADEGVGISKENMSKLFSPYFRAEEIKGIAGSGVGLFHVKQAVNEHNGEIEVKSELNKGTKFTVTIPLKNET